MTKPDETGDRACSRARACQVPDPERVVQVSWADDGVRFTYSDGRPPYWLPPIVELA